jgi:hypothetical protein
MLHLFAALAQKERTLIWDRTKAALKAAKARGAVLDNPRLAEARAHANARQKASAETQLLLFSTSRSPFPGFANLTTALRRLRSRLRSNFARKQLGLTQAQLASLVVISRPQLTNVIAGPFGLSPWLVADCVWRSILPPPHGNKAPRCGLR